MIEVVAVARQKQHRVTKDIVDTILLIAGRGVEGDAHMGEKVKHRYDARKNPDRPNLRQVHLIQSELFDELADRGFAVGPGLMGENVTTRGIDLLSLPKGTRLRLGDDAVVELTGLRSPCVLLDRISPGLMKAVLDRDTDGRLIRKSGVMAVVVAGGQVRPHNQIEVELPAGPPIPLEPV
ncbi:MOSC domain-containing protein [soil metagenome]